MTDEEPKTFYGEAEGWYNLAIKEIDFSKQKEYLRKCNFFLFNAYLKNEIDTFGDLPRNHTDIVHFDKTETSELVKKLKDFFPTEEDFPNLIKQEQSYQC